MDFNRFREFFKDKKVLVTGASGLVGRNLFELFRDNNIDVVGTYYSNEIEGLVYCDLTEFREVHYLMKDIDYIFMIAAKTYGADTLKKSPASMVKDTITMSNNILECALNHKVEKLLYISSSVVYQESFRPLAEHELDWNQDPAKVYMGIGWVKRYLEKLCEFYSQLGLKINIVRPTNIYGKYDKYQEDKSHVVPAIAKRIIERQDPLVIWGNGHAVKDFIYIDNFLRDILKLFVRYDGIDPFNLCTGNLITIRKLVATLLEIEEYNIRPIYDDTKPSAISYKALYRNKFDSLFGKEPYTHIYTGLHEVIQWLRKELNEK